MRTVATKVTKKGPESELPATQQIKCTVPGCHGKASYRRLPGRQDGYYKCDKCGAEYPVPKGLR
jgi:hypothetical protein